MSMKRFLNSNYINASMLEPGVRYEHTITDVDEFTFEGDTQPTAILVLDDGEAKLPLNQTRLKKIGVAFGWNEANWVGKQIVVFRGSAPFKGEIVDAVAVEPVVPNRIAAASPHRIDNRSAKGGWRDDAPPPPDASQGDGPADRCGEPDDDDDVPF
jgi:hypothetical protein